MVYTSIVPGQEWVAIVDLVTTGLGATAVVSKDGGAFVATTNSVVEVGTNGVYKVAITAKEIGQAKQVAVLVTGGGRRELIVARCNDLARDVTAQMTSQVMPQSQQVTQTQLDGLKAYVRALVRNDVLPRL